MSRLTRKELDARRKALDPSNTTYTEREDTESWYLELDAYARAADETLREIENGKCVQPDGAGWCACCETDAQIARAARLEDE